MPALPLHRRPRDANNGWSFRNTFTTFAHRLYATARRVRCRARNAYNDVACLIGCAARKVVGPEKDNKPHHYTVVGIIFGFFLYTICAMLAIKYPSKLYFYLFMLFGGLIYLAMLALVAADIKHRKRPGHYRRNLSNTIITLLLTIPVMTILYGFSWYTALNEVSLQITVEAVNTPAFPSVAIFQEYIWTSMGTLVEGHSKCFLGWYEYGDSTLCSSLTYSQQLLGGSCNCNESWSNIIEDFSWGRNRYRYFSFENRGNLIAANESYTMILQVGFNYNLSQAQLDSSAYQNPSLFLAVYDPTLTLIEALKQGYSRLIMINGNAQHQVNLGLNYRSDLNSTPAYDYDLPLTSVNNIGLVCDTSPDAKYMWPCFVSLTMQIPNFQRTVYSQQMLMNWVDVLAIAGAYFSFVQFLGWIVSGQACAT